MELARYYVHHPDYAGMILFEIGISTLLASWWAIIAGGLCTDHHPTVLEDRTLQAERMGYVDYAYQAHYRRLPCIW